MTTNKRLGDYIQEIDVRNRDLSVTKLLGLSMTKQFRPSTSNIIGVDLSKYKIVGKNVFAFDTMSVIRVHKVPIAINNTDSPIIVSPAYVTFECKNSNELDPQYLMMWFMRNEFDRYADFKSDAAVRGGYDWDELCDTSIYIPPIERQREIVAEYETLSKRIRLNEQMISKLEETAQTLYRKMFVDGIDKENLPEGWRMGTLGEICSKIGSGSTPKGGKDSYTNSGISLIRSMNVFDFNFCYDELAHISNAQATLLDGVTIQEKDILFNITGASVARCCMVPNNVLPARVNQHVMIIRSKHDFMSYYLLCTLCTDETKRSLLGMSQSGSTREAITKTDIESFNIAIPPKEMLKDFASQADIIFSYTDIYKQENSKLTELQSLLLARMGR